MTFRTPGGKPSKAHAETVRRTIELLTRLAAIPLSDEEERLTLELITVLTRKRNSANGA
jgi:hypothetical protein